MTIRRSHGQRRRVAGGGQRANRRMALPGLIGIVAHLGFLDDRFHETSFDEANGRGTGSMLVDSLFEKS